MSCCYSTPSGVCPPFQAAGVGALRPPHGHVGGQHPLLGGLWGVGLGGVLRQGHPDVQLWDEPSPPRPAPGAPPQQSPPPPRNAIPLPWPPPNPRQARRPPHRSASPSNRAATARRQTRHSPVPMGRGRGSSRSSKSGARSPHLWRGMSHLNPCLVSRCMGPTPMVSTRGF